jgi:hypothetical protein
LAAHRGLTEQLFHSRSAKVGRLVGWLLVTLGDVYLFVAASAGGRWPRSLEVCFGAGLKGHQKGKLPELCLANVFPVVVAVAQLAERQVVILDVAGSSPVGYPSSGARVSVHSEARARLQFDRFNRLHRSTRT